ncbi:MAG: hypothetical protein JNN30_11850 [Rhodanobacteraceae bacterium]|nr:hypothetical protein [Rhodanobacteraceae bacterium]
MLLRLLPMLLLSLALSACQPSPAPPIATAPATARNCLTMLPSSPLTSPAAALFTQDFAAAPLDAAGLRCLADVWGETRFASPEAYDPAYASVQAAHGEDTDLRWASIAHERVQLLHIADNAATTIWLLRIDSGLALEGSRYDLIFTSTADGQLRSQMLVGADGIRYSRSIDLRGPRQFTVHEIAGREQQTRPGYNAAFRIDDEGRIVHDPGGVTTPLHATAADEPATRSGDGADDANYSGISIETVAGSPGDAEAVRQLLFSDSGVTEELVQQHALADGSPAMVAVGRTEAAGLVLYVLRPTAGGTPKETRYEVASLAFPEPAQAVGGEVGRLNWEAQKDAIDIALPMRYALLREGGDPSSGEGATQDVERMLRARLVLTDGSLRATN